MSQRRPDLLVLDAPSNLGLRPPERGAVPGVYKLAGALRDAGLVRGLGAGDGGVVTPPRYQGSWQPGAGVRNEAAIARYSVKLADRMQGVVGAGRFPLVLGGDCSILLGAMLALRRHRRCGLAFVDGHTDFRHPGNSSFVGAAAGEDLALVTGRGGTLADLEGRRPLVAEQDVAAIGIRSHDVALTEVRSSGIAVTTAEELHRQGAASVAAEVHTRLERRGVEGYWIHCDVDVLDESVMPAVDTPEPGGLEFDELRELLAGLVDHQLAIGMDITIFDPDLDEDGVLAERLAATLISALGASRVL